MDEKHLEMSVQVTGPAATKTLRGREHAVFPAVLVRQQVLNNNLGRTFLPAEEIEASVAAWNNIPVVIRHPSSRGQPISARSPEVLNTQGAGSIFNARFEDDSLKAEVWIDLAQAEAVTDALDVVNRVKEGEIGEVSTGFATQVENAPGEFDGKAFDLVLRGIQPDHLALLPDETGACSVKDGCGLGVNHEGPCDVPNQLGDPPCPDAAINDSAWQRFVVAAGKALGLIKSDPQPGEGSGASTPEEGTTMNREQKIAHLAEAGTDREALDKLSDGQIEALYAASAKGNSSEPPMPEPSKDDSEAWRIAHHYREENERLRQQYEPAANAQERERAEMLDDLLYNAKSLPYSETEIREMDYATMKKVHQLAFPQRQSFIGRGGPRTSHTATHGSFDFVKPILAPSHESALNSEVN